MKKRNPYFVAIMSLITIGLYELYWFVVTKNELNKKGASIPSVFIVLMPLIGLVGVALLQLLIKFALTSDSASAIVNTVNIISVIVGIVAVVGIVPAGLYWIYKFSKGVEMVSQRRISFDFCIWGYIAASFCGLDFIWAGVLQNKLNNQVQ